MFICVREIDTKTGAPRPISSVLHRNTTARVISDSCQHLIL